MQNMGTWKKIFPGGLELNGSSITAPVTNVQDNSGSAIANLQAWSGFSDVATELNSGGRLFPCYTTTIPYDSPRRLAILPYFTVASETAVVQLWRVHSGTGGTQVGTKFIGPAENIMRTIATGVSSAAQTVTFTASNADQQSLYFYKAADTGTPAIDQLHAVSENPIVDTSAGTAYYVGPVYYYDLFDAEWVMANLVTKPATGSVGLLARIIGV